MPTAEDHYQHQLAIIRVSLRAGLIIHTKWPPVHDYGEAWKAAYLDNLAKEIHRERPEAFHP